MWFSHTIYWNTNVHLVSTELLEIPWGRSLKNSRELDLEVYRGSRHSSKTVYYTMNFVAAASAFAVVLHNDNHIRRADL